MNILITGASSGLGLELLKEALARGHVVIAVDRNPIDSNENVDFYECDLSDIDQIENLTRQLNSKYKVYGIELIINCACAYLMKRIGSVYESNELLKSTVVNFVAPLLIVNNLKPILDIAVNPLVVNISSNAAEGGAFCTHYCMSKGALNSLTYAINEEFRINGKMRAITFSLGTLNTGFALREEVLAVTPVIGKDPIINPDEVAKLIFDIVLKNEFMNFEAIKITPKKQNVRLK